MYVIEVIPLARGVHVESLTYYSATQYPIGSVIVVPIRNKEIRAVVVSVQPISAARTAVRAATFSLKKLPPQQESEPLPPALIETAKALQKIYPATLGALLFALLPREVREGTESLQYTSPLSHADIRPEITVLQGLREDRFIAYRSTVREVFAHRGSVVCVLPTGIAVERAIASLCHGIENRVVSFAPHYSKKKIQENYKQYYDLTNAKLIITTPAHAYLDRHDITHIIVEESRSRHYCARQRPYVDHREVLKTLARVTNRTIILGDIVPQSEDEFSRREERYTTAGEHPRRLPFQSRFTILTQENNPAVKTPFTLFGDDLLKTMRNCVSTRGQIFVYAARRGLAPIVICSDCGYVFRCPDSGAPYSLFTTNKQGVEERWFLATATGRRIRAADTCNACGSWRLRERGIGIQHMERELRSLLPDTPLFLFDHSTTTTYRKAQKIIGDFYNTQGSILLGTRMAVPYLETPVTQCIIPSLDATRSVPTWRSEEEFFALLLSLRELSTEATIVQTRSASDQILEYASQGLTEQFYTDELMLRNELLYPPYVTFVLLAYQGPKEQVLALEAEILRGLTNYKTHCYSAPESLHAKTIRYCLLRIPRASWPDPTLMTYLKGLPPQIKIAINPDRII